MLDSLIHLLVTKQYAPRQETKHPNETSHPIAMPGLAGSWFEVLTVFLRLGLLSFGGPVAHLGYFREEFVVRRRWLEDRSYADLVALCQFLPGPASSQVGLAIGLSRAGYPGAFAAWAGFTLPSAVALVVFGYGLRAFGDVTGAGWLHGLKVVAVAVVAQAVLGMMQSLVPDRERATVAVLSALIMLAIPNSWGQIAAIAMGAGAGATLLRAPMPTDHAALPLKVSRAMGFTMLGIFFALLIGLPWLASTTSLQALKLFDAFYRAGSLVFGGGHVVLPLLQASVVPPGWVTNDAFLAGYGAAQAVPGPLFTFAAYLGAVMGPRPNGWLGASISSLPCSCRHFSSSSAPFRSGRNCGNGRARKQHCAVSTPRWSGYSSRHCTIRSGPPE